MICSRIWSNTVFNNLDLTKYKQSISARFYFRKFLRISEKKQDEYLESGHLWLLWRQWDLYVIRAQYCVFVVKKNYHSLLQVVWDSGVTPSWSIRMPRASTLLPWAMPSSPVWTPFMSSPVWSPSPVGTPSEPSPPWAYAPPQGRNTTLR